MNQEMTNELFSAIYSTLETYSNVHRGSGFKSQVTSHLYEKARLNILDYLQLSPRKYCVIFSSYLHAATIQNLLNENDYTTLNDENTGLPLGVYAFIVKKNKLPNQTAFTGGGTARLISKDWILWAIKHEKFEAGTPAVINIIAFVKALKLTKKYGDHCFEGMTDTSLNVQTAFSFELYNGFSGLELLNKLKQSIIGQKIKIPTTQGLKPFINLDNSASTPTFEPVYQTFKKTLLLHPTHYPDVVHKTKEIIADFLDAPKEIYDIFFTSNTTEAVNLAVKNFHYQTNDLAQGVVLSTTLEHSSNDLPWRNLTNFQLIRLNANNDGSLDLEEFEKILKAYNRDAQYGRKKVNIVSVSGASNVLGLCTDLKAVSRITHAYNALLHVDAAQLIAHHKIDMKEDGIDLLSFSGHKIYAPFGTGALVMKKSCCLFPPEVKEKITMNGHKNIGGIAALGKSLQLFSKVGMENIRNEEHQLTMKFLEAMSGDKNVEIYGVYKTQDQLINKKIGVIPFVLNKKMSDQTAKKMATYGGIGIRYGCHCAHIVVKQILDVKPGLEKFQRFMLTILPKLQLPGVARVSLGIENSTDDIEQLSSTIKLISSGLNGHEVVTMTEVKKQLHNRIVDIESQIFSNQTTVEQA